jgi:hypothetical protein
MRVTTPLSQFISIDPATAFLDDRSLDHARVLFRELDVFGKSGLDELQLFGLLQRFSTVAVADVLELFKYVEARHAMFISFQEFAIFLSLLLASYVRPPPPQPHPPPGAAAAPLPHPPRGQTVRFFRPPLQAAAAAARALGRGQVAGGADVVRLRRHSEA